MKSMGDYFKDLYEDKGFSINGDDVSDSLLQRFHYSNGGWCFRKKTTDPYPAHREENYVSPRFRGRLSMPLDENGNHRCIACGLCQMNCPNETIHIETRTETTPDGKPKKVLARYTYDLGCCLFCQICVRVCPQQAIAFTTDYENAVFERDKLVLTLNPNTL